MSAPPPSTETQVIVAESGIWYRCALVVSLVGLAATLNLLAHRYLTPHQSFAFFYLAIVVATVIGEWRVGLATIIAAAVAVVVLSEPAHVGGRISLLSAPLGLFIVESALLCLITANLNRGRPIRSRHWTQRYGAALVIIAAALSVKMLLLDAPTRDNPFLLLYAAAALAAWAGGLGPCLVATAIGAVAADWFWLSPPSSVALTVDDLWRLTLYFGEAALIGVACTSLDAAIAEANRHRRAERDVSLRNQQLLDTASEHALILLSPDGRIAAWSAGAARIFGHEAATAIGRSFFDLATQDDRLGMVVDAELAEAQARGRSERTGWCVRADGTPIWCETVTTTVRGVPGFAVVVRDVSTRHQAEETQRENEEKIRQAQRLEAVGQLAGGIAHDFNNLLTVILGNLDLLDEQEPPTPFAKGLLEDVRNAGLRASVLTRQLLSYSRRQVVTPRKVDLNAIVNEMGSMLRRVIAEHIAFVPELQPDLPRVLADPGQLEQIVLNLVLNARDVMPKGGTLTVRTAETRIEQHDLPADAEGLPGRYVVLSVIDTGHGMDAATRSRIFEPFFTTKPIGKGTGLGLSTVYGNVHQAKGWIAVESEVGAGSTFRVFLPVAPGSADTDTGHTIAKRPAPERGSETVLLVEDEQGLRDLARRTLESAGYTVLAAGDGQGGLEASKHYSSSIELLVTDLVMPKMNGRQLAKLLKSQRPKLQVLFMSGYSESTLFVLGSQDEAEDKLEKPFSPNELTRKVREILDRC